MLVQRRQVAHHPDFRAHLCAVAADPASVPRAFLILAAVVSVIAESAGYGDDDKGKLGFLVFAAAALSSMFFLTGDSAQPPRCTVIQCRAGGIGRPSSTGSCT